MIEIAFRLAGGIGLFLMGMIMLTDGLKAFAGEALRRALMRFTGTPLKAFGSGVLVTALVQSSSATTVTVIGFVSAGLLTFPQAVGVVMGASLGTTGTGWIVAVLGLKVSVGFYALPLVGAGAFLRLLGTGRWKSLGLALAGFGLIFIGIEALQTGMQGLAGVFNLARLPASGLLGHVLAMLVGVGLTVIMQSSSAAVATTLTALHTNTVNFEQAASLVIGASIGTTVTGVLAAIGGSVPAKRTALAHVLFNAATGLIAIVLLPGLLWLIQWEQEHVGLEAGATSLAAFHSTFIALGVAIFLPGVEWFSRGIEWLLPEKGPVLTRHLDNSLLSVPAVALEATRRALREIAGELFDGVRTGLAATPASSEEARRTQVRQALERTQEFFTKIPPVTEDAPLSELRVAQIHAMDHLLRLQQRLAVPADLRPLLTHPQLQPALVRSREALQLAADGLRGNAPADWLAAVEQCALELADQQRQNRPVVLRQTAAGEWEPAQALAALDAWRWLERLGYHAWRISNYLGGDGRPEPAPHERTSA